MLSRLGSEYVVPAIALAELFDRAVEARGHARDNKRPYSNARLAADNLQHWDIGCGVSLRGTRPTHAA